MPTINTNATPAETPQKITAKWSKPLTAAGFTAIPSVIFERQRALGLDSLDINILLNLAGYWWAPEARPRPSKETLAKTIGVTARTIQRRIADLEKGGYIKRIPRKASAGDNLPNEYDLSGLIKAATPFAEEKMQEIERRKQENEARLTRKKPLVTVQEVIS